MAEYTASAYEDGTNVFKYQDADAIHPNGTTAQYYRGDGSLATFPTIPPGVTVVQTTGTSTANVMSQKAVTDAIDNVDNRLDNVAAALDQQILNVDTDLHIEIERSTDEDASIRTAVSAKQDKSNLVTEWGGSQDNTHYPSEKLVYDSINDVSSTVPKFVKYTYFNNVISGTTDGPERVLRVKLPIGATYNYSQIKLSTSVNGYAIIQTIGWSKSSDVGINPGNLQTSVIYVDSYTASNRKPFTVKAYISDTEDNYLYIYAANNTSVRRTIIEMDAQNYTTLVFDRCSLADIKDGVIDVPMASGNVRVKTPGTAVGNSTRPVYLNAEGNITLCDIGVNGSIGGQKSLKLVTMKPNSDMPSSNSMICILKLYTRDGITTDTSKAGSNVYTIYGVLRGPGSGPSYAVSYNSFYPTDGMAIGWIVNDDKSMTIAANWNSAYHIIGFEVIYTAGMDNGSWTRNGSFSSSTLTLTGTGTRNSQVEGTEKVNLRNWTATGTNSNMSVLIGPTGTPTGNQQVGFCNLTYNRNTKALNNCIAASATSAQKADTVDNYHIVVGSTGTNTATLYFN